MLRNHVTRMGYDIHHTYIRAYGVVSKYYGVYGARIGLGLKAAGSSLCAKRIYPHDEITTVVLRT